MDSLADWYDSMFPPGMAPGRAGGGSGSAGGEDAGGSPEAFAERGKSRRRPPVVILIEDVEGMEKQVWAGLRVMSEFPPLYGLRFVMRIVACRIPYVSSSFTGWDP